MRRKILVTGGAGYVGSHVVRRLAEAGEDVVVLDDLSTGHRAAVGETRLIEGDFGSAALLDRVLGGGEFEFVVHMAAFCEVGESMTDPSAYYANNVAASLGLLDAALKYGIEGIVFSSTAAVYGEPREVPITEEHPTLPTNPYGETKLVFERALDWYHRAHGLSHVALRYFNAAGAHPDGTLGEDHEPESHLIPRLIRSAVRGGEPTPIFGEDYPTRDGTCVRDYVHVMDLAEAHVLAIAAMRREERMGEAMNLGNGEGFTVREVVDAVEGVVGSRPPTRPAARRQGDPAKLVASAGRAAGRLGWKAAHPTLEAIVRTAWEWHRGHPDGFEDRG